MNGSEVAIRYSKGLFNVTDSWELENRLKYLDSFLKIFSNPQIKLFLSNPQISQERKGELLQKVLKDHIDNELLSFLLLLLEKRRFKHLPEIVREFQILFNEFQGILQPRLITAFPADNNIVDSIKSKLSDVYKRKIDLKTEVDPSLLGGGILIIGNQMLDFSVKSKLKKLKQDLLAINV